MRTNIGIVKVVNESKINTMEKLTQEDVKLQQYFNGMLEMAEKTSKSSEDSILSVSYTHLTLPTIYSV